MTFCVRSQSRIANIKQKIYKFPGLGFRGSTTESARSIDFESHKNYFRSEANEGNFIGLLKLMAGENTELAEYIKTCDEYSKTKRRNPLPFLSKNFVNNALCVIRKFLVEKIAKEICDCGGHFGVLMDGSQDVSSKEQISVVVRYLNDSSNIIERTIAIFNASKNTSGKALYESMRTVLTNAGLSISNVIGCSFDGGSNMRSDNIGVKAFLQQDNPHCVYMWCLSHRFNLVMKTATGSSELVKRVLLFAENSAKLFRSSYARMNVWIDVVKSIPGISSQRRLKLIGTTRWSSKQEAIAGIIGSVASLYALIKSLVKVCNLDKLEGTSLIHASEILNFWLTYENVVITFMLHKIFSLLDPVTKYSQNKGINIVDGILSLRKASEKLDESTERLLEYIEDAKKFIERTNVLLENDLNIRSLGSNNECSVIFPTKDEMQKINKTIENDFRNLIQVLQDEIHGRILNDFDESESIFHEMMYLDPRYSEANQNSISFKKMSEINNIADDNVAVNEMKAFLSDFRRHRKHVPNNTELNTDPQSDESLDGDQENYLLTEDENDLAELNMIAENMSLKPMKMQDSICDCIKCMLKYLSPPDRREKYKNVWKLYKYVSILPATQVKCERDFSKMKIIKSHLRSCLKDENLENLIIISVESDIFQNIDLDEILNAIIKSSKKISLYMG